MDDVSSILPAGFGAGTLVASLIWGSIGFGMFIFGKKQQSAGPLFGGIGVMGVTYFITSPLYMSLTALAIIGGVYAWHRM